MLDYSTAFQITLGFSITCFILGYVLGKVGIAKIESDINTIKGLVSGSQKVTVIPAPAPNSTAVVTPAAVEVVAAKPNEAPSVRAGS
jgi:hypothetical protein